MGSVGAERAAVPAGAAGPSSGRLLQQPKEEERRRPLRGAILDPLYPMATNPTRRAPEVGLWIEHRRIAGWVLLFGPGACGVLWLAAGLLIGGVPLLQLAAGPPLLTAFLLVGLRRTLRRRVRAAEEGEEPPAPHRRTTFVLGLVGVLAGAAIGMFGHHVPAVLEPGGAAAPWLTGPVLGAVVLAGALLLALFARFYGTTRAELLPEAPGLGTWLCACAWTSGLAGAALLAPVVYAPAAEVLYPVAHGAGAVVLGAVLLELCLRGVTRRPARIEPAYRPFLLGLVASRWNPVSSLFGTLTDAFGIDLRGTWALRFIQRSLAPLALGLLLLAWLGSAFTLIDTDEVGMLETFGAPSDGPPLEPGVTLHAPWPIQRVRRVSTDRVRTLPIGFVGDQKGASLLWTQRHAEEEYELLLGDGEDLVTVNAILHYRVADPRAYLYEVSDVDGALASVADRALMQRTVGRTLDQVLSENVAALSRAVEAGVQAQADRLGLGIEVLDLNLIGLHPPMAVARDYQAVVSAQIEQDTLRFEALADRERSLPGAVAKARAARAAARAEAARRTARARGEADAFEAQVEASRAAPELYRFRRALESRERQLAGLPLVVIDERLERQGAVLRAEVGRSASRGSGDGQEETNR